MRALVVTHNYPRFPGDPAGAFVRRLALGVCQAGAQVTVVCPWAPGAPSTPHEDEGVVVRRFRYPGDERSPVAYTGDLHRRAARSPGVALRLPFFVRRFGQAVRDAVRDFAPTVVHAHWWIPGGWLASRTGRPYLVTCHGSDVRLLERWPPLRPVGRRVFARAGRLTTVSAFLAADVSRFARGTAGPVVVTPMPVDLDLFARGRSVPKTVPPRVLYAGNLVPSKGVDLLIRALGRLRARQVAARVRIVGEGPAEADLRAAARREGVGDAVEWSCFVPHEAMPAEYGAATVTVLPTRGRAEGLGLTLVEALLAGGAVVGSAVGGIPEVVQDGETGLLFADGDVEGLANALARMLTDPALRERLAAEGCRRVTARYAPPAAAQRFLNLYHDIADRRPSGSPAA
jgi:glycosyltransferase involved in cell wall biosynthesis